MIHNKHYEILKPFLKDYNTQVYGRELIGKVHTSQKNIALILNKLEKQNILTSQKKAGAKYFSLNIKNPLIQKYILLLETIHSIVFLQNHKKIKHIIDKINPKPQIMCIIGGYAKNQENPNDLDFFIVGNINKNILKELSETYNLKIHPLIFSMHEFLKALKENNEFIKEVINNHIILSGYERFINILFKQK